MAHDRDDLSIEPYTLVEPTKWIEDDTARYLYDEIRRLQLTVDHLTEAAPQVAYAAPDLPRKGTIRWNVSPWDPIGDGSEGMVQYNGTEWVVLGIFADNLRATVFDDLMPTALHGKGASIPIVTSYRGNLATFAFKGSGPVEELFFNVHFTHGIKAGSTPTFHVHWASNAASPSGNVKWNIDYSLAKGYGVDTHPAETTVSTVQASSVQYQHEITDDDDMGIVTAGDLEPDSVAVCRLWRDSGDAADTSPDDAFMFRVDLHVERDKVGTIERNRPFTGY